MAMTEVEKSIQEELSLPILLAERVIKFAKEAESFKPENNDLATQVAQISQQLRAVARLTTASAVIYDRPIRRVTADITKSLDRVLALSRKCRHKKTNVLRHVLSIITTNDFKKVSNLLDSSLADVRWLLSIFNPDSENGTINLSLPPIASNDPILAWVWSNIAAVQMGRSEAAQDLALAGDNDRTKKVIVEENGIPPLLKLLKENVNSDAQNAAANALYNLADDQERVEAIANALGVQIIAKALSVAPMRVQIKLVKLVSRMVEMDIKVQEEFGRENVTRTLVSLLGMDVDLEDIKEVASRTTATSLHLLVQINKEMERIGGSGLGGGNSLDGSLHHNGKKEKEKEREAESMEVKLKLKASCATALWKLARGSLFNSKKITETKALLVLAKIIEKEKGVLQINCLTVVMELAAVAESNADLKRSAFKPNSPVGKAVLDQLLRVINEERSVTLVIPATKAIGCLARTFPAKETRIIEPLVALLGHRNPEVAAEAAKALGKFVRDDNFNRKEHSMAIVEFNGVPKLMNLLRTGDRSQLQLHELVLLCNLAINVGNRKALEQERALSVLEGAARHAVMQHPDLRELFSKAIHQLTLYQSGAHTHIKA
ncbi:armadillo repeat only 4 [Abeliophyllum distichum]|uniref:Armadillo repeat only 4 n=1 Tax=Abeliophyllum distichum TaxID=126358 RepID=A0ABD1RVT9_9LAMI